MRFALACIASLAIWAAPAAAVAGEEEAAPFGELIRPRPAPSLRQVLKTHRLPLSFRCSEECGIRATFSDRNTRQADAEGKSGPDDRGTVVFELDRDAREELRYEAEYGRYRVGFWAVFRVDGRNVYKTTIHFKLRP